MEDNILPLECYEKILGYIQDPRDIINFALVDKSVHSLILRDKSWKTLLKIRFPSLSLFTDERLFFINEKMSWFEIYQALHWMDKISICCFISEAFGENDEYGLDNLDLVSFYGFCNEFIMHDKFITKYSSAYRKLYTITKVQLLINSERDFEYDAELLEDIGRCVRFNDVKNLKYILDNVDKVWVEVDQHWNEGGNISGNIFDFILFGLVYRTFVYPGDDPEEEGEIPLLANPDKKDEDITDILKIIQGYDAGFFTNDDYCDYQRIKSIVRYVKINPNTNISISTLKWIEDQYSFIPGIKEMLAEV